MDAAKMAKLSPAERKAFTRAGQKAAGKRKREKLKQEKAVLKHESCSTAQSPVSP